MQERKSIPLDQRLENFLLMYRITPHASTGVPPCKLFLGHDLRTRLHLLEPQLETTVRNHQATQKTPHDNQAKSRECFVGQEVMARNLRQGVKYLPGVIAQRLGPVTYLVDMNDGVVWRRHVDHIKPLQETSGNEILSRVQAEHEDVRTRIPTCHLLMLLIAAGVRYKINLLDIYVDRVDSLRDQYKLLRGPIHLETTIVQLGMEM